jgi:hypothetical protein
LLLAGSIRGVLQRRSTYVRPSSPATRLGKPGAAPATPASLLGDSSRAAAARAAAARKPVVAPVPSTLHRLTAPAANDRTLDQIAHLNDLHQQGALTDAEFQQAKAKLLSEL